MSLNRFSQKGHATKRSRAVYILSKLLGAANVKKGFCGLGQVLGVGRGQFGVAPTRHNGTVRLITCT